MEPPELGLNSYFSVDDILAGQLSVKCRLLQPVKRLGALAQCVSMGPPGATGSEDSSMLQAGTVLDLPLWLVLQLHVDQRQPVLHVLPPKALTPAFFDVFRADAAVLSLQQLGSYFYKTSLALAQLSPDVDENEVRNILLQVYGARCVKLFDLAANLPINADNTAILDKLDDTERTMFFIGQRAAAGLQAWSSRQMVKLKASAMVDMVRKRKYPFAMATASGGAVATESTLAAASANNV